MINEGHVVPVEVPMPQPSLIDSFKNALQPDTLANRLGVDKNTLIDMGIYGAIGFIFGFLLKKYSEYFIAAVLFVVGMIVLQQFGYVSIDLNTAKIHEVMGLQSTALISEGYGSLLLAWMKSHVPAAASLVVGFLVGLKCA